MHDPYWLIDVFAVLGFCGFLTSCAWIGWAIWDTVAERRRDRRETLLMQARANDVEFLAFQHDAVHGIGREVEDAEWGWAA